MNIRHAFKRRSDQQIGDYFFSVQGVHFSLYLVNICVNHL